MGVRILEKLRGNPAMGEVILGGGFALQHYHDFRATHDIDALWSNAPSGDARAAIEKAVRETAAENGLTFRSAVWGDTISYEIIDVRRPKVFSFQIAVRDVPLDQPLKSEWEPILIETLRDNVGSKMNALVNRGLPRDFTDVYELIDAGYCSVSDCWELWELKNPSADVREAKDAVLMKLAEIEARRPLDSVSEADRENVQKRRTFFKTIFTNGDGENVH